MGNEVLQQREANRTNSYQSNNEVYVLRPFVLGQSNDGISKIRTNYKSLINLVLSTSLLDTCKVVQI